MEPADAYRQLIAFCESPPGPGGGRLFELGEAVAALQPSVPADSLADHLLDSVREQLRARSGAGDARRAEQQLAVDLRELLAAATDDLARLTPDPALAIRASLRWTGPPEDADAVAQHFGPADVSWPNPALPAPSRFETTLRIGDSVARPYLDAVVGAALRQLPALLGTSEGDEPAEHWWARGRLELLATVPTTDAGTRDLALTASVAARLATWGATLHLDIHG